MKNHPPLCRYALLALAVSGAPAFASDVWSPNFSNLWNDDRNWSEQHVPGNGDDAIVSGSPKIIETAGAGNLALSGDLFLSASADPVDYVALVVNNNLTLNGTITLNGLSNVSAGLVAGNLFISSTSTVNIASGIASVSGNIFNAGTLTVATSSQADSDLTNTGQVNIGAGITYSHYGGNINLNAGNITLANGSTMVFNASTLNLNAGNFTNTAALDPDYTNPTTGGAVILLDSYVNFGAADGKGIVLNMAIEGVLSSNIPANGTVAAFSTLATGGCNLSVPDTFTNNGTLAFYLNGGQSSALLTSGGDALITNNGVMITSATDATTLLEIGASFTNNGIFLVDSRIVFSGTTTNNSVISVGSSGSFYLNGGTFNQNAGTLGTSGGGGTFTLNSGTFNYNGGIVYSTLNLNGSHLYIGVADGHGLTINACGTTILDSSLPLHTTLTSIANATNTVSQLVFPANSTSSGNITIHAYDGTSPQFSASGGTFTNNGAFTVDTNAGGGTLYILDGFINNGIVHINADTTLADTSNSLDFNIGNGATLSLTSARFNQDAGFLGNTAASHVVVHSGGFNFNGGTVNATVDLYNSYFSTAVANAHGTVFNLYGANTLNGNLAASANVYAASNDAVGNGSLHVADGATNHGSIFIQATTSHGIDFVINDYNPGTFHNAGAINFQPDASTSSSVYGLIDNTSTGNIYVNGRTIFNGDIINNGSIIINKGHTAELAAGQTLYQYGTLEIDGSLSLDAGAQLVPSGAFTLNIGGEFAYPADLSLNNGATIAVQGEGAKLTLSGKLAVGGHIVASGAGNIVSTNGSNIVASGAGNIVASGAGNIVSSGAGNLISQDGGSIVASGAGNIVSSGAGNIVASGAGNIVASGAGNIVASGAGNVIAAAGGSIVASGAGNIVASGAGNFVPHAIANILVANALRPAVTLSNATYSIIAQSNGTISLDAGNLLADNVVEIQANASLSGNGNITAALATSGGDITPANGTLTFNAPLTASGGTLGGPTGLLSLKNGLTITAPTALHGTTQTSALTLAGSSNNWSTTLDLRNSALILQPADADKPAALATLQNQLAYGNSHPTGILSSTLTPAMSIVLLDNALANLTTFRGATLSPDSIVAIPALSGDANFDGTVDSTDLTTVLTHLGTPTSLWTNGNFDNTATIDLNDLNAVLNHLGTSYATNSTVQYAESLNAAAVPTPEPGSLSVIAAVLPLFLQFWRRRKVTL